jgi:CRP-like cAMP-binding protein
MSKATQQQDVAVLSSSKQGLVFLTANDWALIVDKGSRMQFKVGDRVVQHGKRTHGIYLLLKGTASVQIARPAISPFALPAIGPGEVCGEISFLDELPATASVVAKEPVEAYYLDRPTLQSLFELFPHLGSRFYRSLACSLSRRLREWIGPVDAVKLDSLRPDPIKDPVKADSAKKE